MNAVGGTHCRVPDVTVGLLLVLCIPRPSDGKINLEWRPATQSAFVGVTVELGLYAVSDSSEDQLLSVVEVVFSWDPTYLHLIGLDPSGGVPLLFSGFPTSGDCGLNEAAPPQDGDGLYRAWANFGSPVPATPEGTPLTTLQFEALQGTLLTPTMVLMLNSNGSGECSTAVVDGVIPGRIVTGEIGSATVIVNTTLGRTAYNLIRLEFDDDITVPDGEDVRIEMLDSNGAFGPSYTTSTNGSADFEVTVATNGLGQPRVLEIRENGSVLTNRTWIAVRNTGDWADVEPFEVHYMVQCGDVDNDGNVLFADISTIIPVLGHFADDDDRRDVDGEGHVLIADISSLIPYLGNGPVERPSGHE